MSSMVQVTHHYEFNTNDLVLLFQPRVNTISVELEHSHIWISAWQGPYTIVKHKFDKSDIYIIKDPSTLREFSISVHR